jgi:large subunit ribosomal protein L23
MDAKVLYGIVGRPIVTEKTTVQRDQDNKVVFRVSQDANKVQIRQAVEKLFGVRVLKVNTSRMPSKPKRVGRISGRRAGFKKAVVTLAEGDSIEFYEVEGDAGEFEGVV